MTNPNNCATCDHRKREHGEGHCFMFRKEPEGVCMQHTGRKTMTGTPILDLLRNLRRSGQGPAA